MNKLSYGIFDPDNADIAFSATNQYSNPVGELAMRKQLSYPLKEVKTFVNNTVSVDTDDNAVQLVVSNDTIGYRTTPGGEVQTISSGLGIDSVYPVGSIYMSVNNTNPSTLFPDTTWVLISSVALASEHIYGNGYSLGLTDGTHKFAPNNSGANTNFNTADKYGLAVGSSGSGSGRVPTTTGIALGVVTKTLETSNPEYTGLIADTIAVYMFKRTA